MNLRATVLATTPCPGKHRLLRLAARELAAEVGPGQGVGVDDAVLPVMGADATAGWVDCLGGPADPAPAVGEKIGLNGPLGEAFDLKTAGPRALLLGDVLGVAQIVFLARRLAVHSPRVKPLVLLVAEGNLPFRPTPSRIIVPGLPGAVIAALPLLEDWHIPSRLASTTGLPGCHAGTLESLARHWLGSLQGVADTRIYACGGAAVVACAARLALHHALPLQRRVVVPQGGATSPPGS